LIGSDLTIPLAIVEDNFDLPDVTVTFFLANLETESCIFYGYSNQYETEKPRGILFPVDCNGLVAERVRDAAAQEEIVGV
jgi:hypothetical protein